MSGSVLTPRGILDNVTDFGLRLSGTDFPVSVFPQSIRHIIQELHECQSFPVDYVAASMLTAIAVGIGNTHLVQVKSGWQNEQCLEVLRGRTVTLFPDLGATDYWRSKIPMMRSLGIDIHMYDYLERAATEEQRQQGLDIADFLPDIETAEGWLEQARQINQSVDKLVNQFQLHPVYG